MKHPFTLLALAIAAIAAFASGPDTQSPPLSIEVPSWHFDDAGTMVYGLEFVPSIEAVLAEAQAAPLIIPIPDLCYIAEARIEEGKTPSRHPAGYVRHHWLAPLALKSRHSAVPPSQIATSTSPRHYPSRVV